MCPFPVFVPFAPFLRPGSFSLSFIYFHCHFLLSLLFVTFVHPLPLSRSFVPFPCLFISPPSMFSSLHPLPSSLASVPFLSLSTPFLLSFSLSFVSFLLHVSSVLFPCLSPCCRPLTSPSLPPLAPLPPFSPSVHPFPLSAYHGDDADNDDYDDDNDDYDDDDEAVTLPFEGVFWGLFSTRARPERPAPSKRPCSDSGEPS